MYDISQNPFYLYSVHRTSVLGERFRANGPLVLFGKEVNDLEGKAFNPFPNKSWFLSVCSTNLLKTLWVKEKLLVMSNFSFSHSVFYLAAGLSTIFIKFKIVVCKRFQFGRV